MKAAAPALNVNVPRVFGFLFQPARYKVSYGGRGSTKSWSFARGLIAHAYVSRKRILCVREYQSSIADSVHHLLEDQIEQMGVSRYFTVQKSTISSHNGSEFIFKGLRHSIQEIKSTEAVDICWVEEAQSVSKESWQTLIPTIRKTGSEIWVTFNPYLEEDPTYQRFVINPDPRAIVRKTSWRDNPWFSKELNDERLRDLAVDPDAYDWIWEGHTRKLTEATIFRNVAFETFETPNDIDRFFYGVDWGFANDPTVMLRLFIRDGVLYVDHEAYGYGTEIDRLAELFDRVPGARQWPIKADSSRPETISYMRRQGFNIDAAEKWPGSVEDGIAHLKGFRQIVIHPRCPRFSQEARLYSYKVDKQSGDILPVVVDRHNHGWDSARYALDGYIQSRGGLGVWERLAS